MRRLDGITDLMDVSLSGLWDVVSVWEVRRAAVHGVAKTRTRLSAFHWAPPGSPFPSCPAFLPPASPPCLLPAPALCCLQHMWDCPETLFRSPLLSPHIASWCLFGSERHTFHSGRLVVANEHDVSVGLCVVSGAVSRWPWGHLICTHTILAPAGPRAPGHSQTNCPQLQNPGANSCSGVWKGPLSPGAAWPALDCKACSKAGTSPNRTGKLLYKEERSGPKGPGVQAFPSPHGLMGLPYLKKNFIRMSGALLYDPSKSAFLPLLTEKS